MIPEGPGVAAPRGPAARTPAARELFVVVAVLCALAAGGPPLTAWLQYDRDALAAGQWWRLVTAHLVHLGWGHLAMNVAGLLGLWWLYGDLKDRRDWLAVSTVCALSVSILLYSFSPAVDWYVGLSGVLHGLWAAGALALCRTSRLEGVGSLVVLGAKLALEYGYGPLSSGGAEALPVVTVAHRYGALGGIAGALLIATKAGERRRRQSL
jgi:rhomboid family GlyGly-CTERM serine protease